MSGKNPNQVFYRPELDGLRAIAIIAVIINHINHEILPSGFLGVDIFFVISGYVITASIKRRKSKSFKDFILGFYERRIKRLVPALIAYVITLSLLISFFNPTPSFALKTGLTSLFGVSNIFLYFSSFDYFANSTLLNPFVNTWSLGVEEQFYFIFPLIIWFSGYGKKTFYGKNKFPIIISFLSILSLISFLIFYNQNPPAGYFLMPNRFWEISMGCLVFLLQEKKPKPNKNKYQTASLIFFIGIIILFFIPSDVAIISTILIVILVSLLIYRNDQTGIVFRTLTYKKIRFIGLISYSLYLWHWGILSVSRFTIGIYWWTIPFQILLVLFISIFSYKYIELPYRNNTWFLSKGKTVIAGVLILICGGIFEYILGKTFKHKLYLGKRDNLENCQIVQEINEPNLNIIFGDSHALAFQGVVRAFDPNCKLVRGENNKYVGNNFLYDIERINNKKFTEFSVKLLNVENLINHLKKNEPKSIIISSYWLMHFSPQSMRLPSYSGIVSKHISENNSEISFENAFLKHISNFKKLSDSMSEKVKIIIVLPFPEFNWVNNGGIGNLSCEPQWFNFNNTYSPAVKEICEEYNIPAIESKKNVEERRKFIVNNLKKLEINSKNVFLFDPIESLCTDEFCSTHDRDGIRMFRDDDHIGKNGVLKLIGPFKKFYEKLYF